MAMLNYLVPLATQNDRTSYLAERHQIYPLRYTSLTNTTSLSTAVLSEVISLSNLFGCTTTYPFDSH